MMTEKIKASERRMARSAIGAALSLIAVWALFISSLMEALAWSAW